MYYAILQIITLRSFYLSSINVKKIRKLTYNAKFKKWYNSYIITQQCLESFMLVKRRSAVQHQSKAYNMMHLTSKYTNLNNHTFFLAHSY